MSHFFVDLLTVIRDKKADFTQILTFVLAVRFPKASTIIVAGQAQHLWLQKCQGMERPL
jgi:hypothetical protein